MISVEKRRNGKTPQELEDDRRRTAEGVATGRAIGDSQGINSSSVEYVVDLLANDSNQQDPSKSSGIAHGFGASFANIVTGATEAELSADVSTLVPREARAEVARYRGRLLALHNGVRDGMAQALLSAAAFRVESTPVSPLEQTSAPAALQGSSQG